MGMPVDADHEGRDIGFSGTMVISPPPYTPFTRTLRFSIGGLAAVIRNILIDVRQIDCYDTRHDNQNPKIGDIHPGFN